MAHDIPAILQKLVNVLSPQCIWHQQLVQDDGQNTVAEVQLWCQDAIVAHALADSSWLHRYLCTGQGARTSTASPKSCCPNDLHSQTPHLTVDVCLFASPIQLVQVDNEGIHCSVDGVAIFVQMAAMKHWPHSRPQTAPGRAPASPLALSAK